MTMPFHPAQIFIDQTVADRPMTHHILAKFPDITPHYIEDTKTFKKPASMSWAKKGLLLARHKTDHPLKSFDAVTQSCGRPYYSLDLISNCHLECTYCILQSYLANNPVITIYTNVDEILDKLIRQLETIHDSRSTIPAIINTGRIADSLALESIAGWHQILIPFFGRLEKNILLELKTKSEDVDSILNLPHHEKTVVSWSVNPQNIIDREEFKTASLSQRLAAAKKCSEAGYKIGFHLDPMIIHEGWEKNYTTLVEKIFDSVAPEKISWMSLGLLRFPARQQKTMKNRFPKSAQIHEGLQHSHLPYLTYKPHLRHTIYQTLAPYITQVVRNFFTVPSDNLVR